MKFQKNFVTSIWCCLLLSTYYGLLSHPGTFPAFFLWFKFGLGLIILILFWLVKFHRFLSFVMFRVVCQFGLQLVFALFDLCFFFGIIYIVHFFCLFLAQFMSVLVCNKSLNLLCVFGWCSNFDVVLFICRTNNLRYDIMIKLQLYHKVYASWNLMIFFCRY